jgi:hypothetical protein
MFANFTKMSAFRVPLCYLEFKTLTKQYLNIDFDTKRALPDGDPVVDDDLDPAAEPEAEVENSGVLVSLGETLILRNHLETNFNFFFRQFQNFFRNFRILLFRQS